MQTYEIDLALTSRHGRHDAVVTALASTLLHASSSVPEIAGIELRTTTQTGEPVTLRLFAHVTVDSVVCAAETPRADTAEVSLVYYATRLGAFNDLADDRSTVLVERRVNGRLLPYPAAAVGGLDDVNTITQAITLLLRTHASASTPDQAHAALAVAAQAAGTTVAEHASHLLVHSDRR